MSDDLPPLYLSRRETEALLVAVEMALRLDSGVLAHPDIQKAAEEQISAREGPSGIGRVDQALAAARERLPVLHRLHSMLVAQLEEFHGPEQ